MRFLYFPSLEMKCRCNPIAESDLATYIVNCISEKDKWNQVSTT